MKLLLDTHIWLWSLGEPHRLSRRVAKELDDRQNELWLSPISVWESFLLFRKKRIQISNMTVGAVPDYVKMQAAIFADGSSSGMPEKVTQLVERRRFTLATTRELIGRLEKAQSAGTAKALVIADLRQWAGSIEPQGRPNRNSQTTINQAAGRSLIADAAAGLDAHSIKEELARLGASEKALAASKPPL